MLSNPLGYGRGGEEKIRTNLIIDKSDLFLRCYVPPALIQTLNLDMKRLYNHFHLHLRHYIQLRLEPLIAWRNELAFVIEFPGPDVAEPLRKSLRIWINKRMNINEH